MTRLATRTALAVSIILLAACGRAGYPWPEPEPDAGHDDTGVPEEEDASSAGEDGYVVTSGWTIRGDVPTVARCAADRIARVRLRILDSDAAILDELNGLCEDGHVDGAVRLPWGIRHYGEWIALAADGEVLQRIPVSMPIVAVWPADVLEVVPGDFEVRPAELGDFRAGGVATVATSGGTCEERGIDELRLTLQPRSGDAISVASACESRVFLQTEPILRWEETYAIRWDALDSTGRVVITADLEPIRMLAPVRAAYGLDLIF